MLANWSIVDRTLNIKQISTIINLCAIIIIKIIKDEDEEMMNEL